jgi:hypothetical protein
MPEREENSVKKRKIYLPFFGACVILTYADVTGAFQHGWSALFSALL